ncbi:N-acetyltransferase family protein [Peribacillus sp. NPDC097675]|uniref:GNAT family N-acetyltransferase n=1 Tax=Peribacillus sp. NPDC097675 TaxID=3390618 RepID=UPI003D0272B8
MLVDSHEFHVRNLSYHVRSAMEMDAKSLSEVRVQVDGETENLDREKGEAYLDELGFRQLIKNDAEHNTSLFLVAEINNKIVGFSRCEGNNLNRTSHKVEFGVCVLKKYWGYGIGQNLLKKSLQWADSNGIRKVVLYVLETNHTAIKLYEKYGFEVEGILKKDKLLSDGNFYNTLVMGRFL